LAPNRGWGLTTSSPAIMIPACAPRGWSARLGATNLSLDSAQNDPLAQLAQELQDGAFASAPSSSVEAPPPPAQRAPTMGNIQKVRYNHDHLIDLIIANPGITQNELAAIVKYTPAWVSNIMASDAFQARLAERRKEVIDPVLVATCEERARALFCRAQEVLMEKLDKPVVSDQAALRAFELGAKAIGLGGNAAPKIVPVDLSLLAKRLENLQTGRTLEGEAQVVNG
jgi:hypothetical protein